MRRVGVLLFFSITIGCSSTSSSLPPPGDGGAEAGVDAATTADASAHNDAAADAGCAPITKPEFPCVVDSDCAAAAPPQNLESYCCAEISREPGSCGTLSLVETSCTHGGCGAAPLTCTATTGSVGSQHLCGTASDCVDTGQQCCTVCSGGLSISLCLSSADATDLGAQCQ